MRSLSALSCVLFAACAAQPPRGSVPRAAARSDAAVVHISSECTGVLVTRQAVLTAAHCLESAGPWSVALRTDPTGPRAEVEVTGCAVHPRAYAIRRGCGEGPGRSVAAHDLAVLTLARAVPVRPLEVFLTPPSLRGRWWRDRRVGIVGWDRRPRIVGPLARRSGPNRIERMDGATFRTAPLSRRGFSSVIGDSGAPALLDVGPEERVLGILYGGSAPGDPGSVWVSTAAPENARWLVEVLDRDFAADLSHLNPDDPYDRADWSDVALRLLGDAIRR